MPSIEVSAEQRAYVMALRDELSEQITYGHVRVEDAVQYLIDHHRNDGEVDVEVDAAIEPEASDETDGAAGGPAGRELDIGDELSSPGGTGGGPDAGGGTDDGTDGAAAVTDGEEATGDDGSTEAASDEGDDSPSIVESAAALGGGAGPTADGDGDEDGDDGDGDDMVGRMMQLLDTHDEKWSESDGGDGKYEVELPDGGVETAMTRDDVRALLFQHYR